MGKCKCLPQRMLQGEMKANSICISSVTLDVFPLPFRLELTHTHTFLPQSYSIASCSSQEFRRNPPFTHDTTCQSTGSKQGRQRESPGSCGPAEPCCSSGASMGSLLSPWVGGRWQDLHPPPAITPGQRYGPISQIKTNTTVPELCFYTVRSKISAAT